MTTHDTAFQFAAANLRFGTGITGEVGHDLVDLGARRTLRRCRSGAPRYGNGETVLASLKAARVDFDVYDRIVVEPTDASFREAATLLLAAASSIRSWPSEAAARSTRPKPPTCMRRTTAEFFDFVNAPIGKGLPVPGPLKPLIAIPTTAGTGSETTGVAIFDYVEKRAKTGIAHRYLKPTLGIVDADNTRHAPAGRRRLERVSTC